jgi:hypothetical protein
MRERSKAPAHSHIQVLTDVVTHSHPWILSTSSEERILLQRLEEEFPLLEEIGCKVGIAVATGCDAIFIGQQEELPIEANRTLPLLMTDDVQTGQIVWSGKVVVNPFEAPAGAIIGVAGLSDSGHRDVLAVAAGLLPANKGRVQLPNGDEVRRNLRDAVRQGVALVPGDRRAVGLMLDKPVWDNIAQVRAIALRRDDSLHSDRRYRLE